jgi:hypothetical protein
MLNNHILITFVRLSIQHVDGLMYVEKKEELNKQIQSKSYQVKKIDEEDDLNILSHLKDKEIVDYILDL